MKILKKLSFVFLLSFLGVGLWTSCNELKNAFSNGINFTKPEETSNLNELLNKHITEDMIVHEIKFDYSESNKSFSLCKDGATIVYVDADDKTVLHGIEIDLKTGDFGPDKWLEEHPSNIKRAQKGVQLKEFDFSKIAEIVNAAIQTLQKQEIETSGLGSFKIDFSSGNIEKYVYDFDLQRRTGSTTQGRMTRVSYDEYSFKADKEGNLTFD